MLGDLKVCTFRVTWTACDTFELHSLEIRRLKKLLSSYRDTLRVQPPSVVSNAFAFEVLGGLHHDALVVLCRLQGG